MVDLAIRVEVKGADEVARLIGRVPKRLTNLEPAWTAVTKKFFEIEEEVFDTEGYNGWAPLSPTYAAWKARRYPGRPLLVRTGALKRTATGGGRGLSVRASSHDLVIRMNTPAYAHYHQTGTSKMPARPFIILKEADRLALLRIAREEIRKLLQL